MFSTCVFNKGSVYGELVGEYSFILYTPLGIILTKHLQTAQTIKHKVCLLLYNSEELGQIQREIVSFTYSPSPSFLLSIISFLLT